MSDDRAVFEARRGPVLASILFFGAGFCLAVACLASLPTMAREEKNKRPIVVYSVFGPIMLGFAGLSMYLVVKSRRNLGLRVEAGLEGLTIHRRGDVEVCSWDEIEIVWHKIKIGASGLDDLLGTYFEGSRCVYTVQRRRDGARFAFNALLLNVESLGYMIQRQTVPRLFPPILAAVRAGDTVWFGKLGVGPDGLSRGRKFLPWNEVGDVHLENGLVVTRKQGGRPAWGNVDMGRVPNLYVYLRLVNQWLPPSLDPS